MGQEGGGRGQGGVGVVGQGSRHLPACRLRCALKSVPCITLVRVGAARTAGAARSLAVTRDRLALPARRLRLAFSAAVVIGVRLVSVTGAVYADLVTRNKVFSCCVITS